MLELSQLGFPDCNHFFKRTTLQVLTFGIENHAAVVQSDRETIFLIDCSFIDEDLIRGIFFFAAPNYYYNTRC